MNKLFPNKWRRKTKDVVKSVMLTFIDRCKHLRSKIHEDNQRIIPSNFFNEVKPSEVKPKTVVRKKVPTLKKLSMKKLLTIQKPSEIDSQLAQKMINPYYFSQRLNVGYNIELDSHKPLQ